MLTLRRPSAWIASFVATSTSFLGYKQSLPIWQATALQTPVSDHHLAIRRPGPLLWGFGAQWDLHNVSFHFALTSRVRTPPSKIFTFTSRGVAAMAARKPSTRNRRRLRCVCKMWGAVKSAGSVSLLECTICDKSGFPSVGTQPVGMPKIARFLHTGACYKIHQFSMQIINCSKQEPFTIHPFAGTKTVGFYWTLVGFNDIVRPCLFVCFWLWRASRAQKVATTNNFRSIEVKMVLTWSCPPWGKIHLLSERQGNLWTCVYRSRVWKVLYMSPTESHWKSERHPDVQWFLHPEIYMESRWNPVKINRGEGVHQSIASW